MYKIKLTLVSLSLLTAGLVFSQNADKNIISTLR